VLLRRYVWERSIVAPSAENVPLAEKEPVVGKL